MMKGTYSLKVAMDHSVSMEVCQPFSGAHQLGSSQPLPNRRRRIQKRGTYKLESVCFRILLYELIDISVCHPV